MSALPEGLPSALINRRPDIRAAERRLKAANANIGAARAAFFPSISLTAAVGVTSAEFSSLFKSGSRTWSFAPQLLQPIFDAGRNSGNLSLAEARANLAVADYEKTIQVAFREVADALAARSYVADQVAAQRAVQAAQADRLRLLRLRQQGGIASTLDVLDAQRELFSAQQSLVQARLLRTTSAIDLYRALGGGVK
jgi:multidrug efflux system outer membrane protein